MSGVKDFSHRKPKITNGNVVSQPLSQDASIQWFSRKRTEIIPFTKRYGKNEKQRSQPNTEHQKILEEPLCCLTATSKVQTWLNEKALRSKRQNHVPFAGGSSALP